MYHTIPGLVLLLLSIFALYLSFKCNKGFDLIGFLGAVLFPYIYIPYKLATCGTNILSN